MELKEAVESLRILLVKIYGGYDPLMQAVDRIAQPLVRCIDMTTLR